MIGAGTAAAGIGLLGTSAFLIASAALHPSIGALQVAIVGVRFFGLSRGILRYIERLLSHSVNFRLLSRMRVWFYRAVEPLAPAGLENYRGGDLLARSVGDINTLENFYVRAVSPPVVALIVTVGVGLFAGQMRPLLGWVLACGLAIAGIAAPALTFLLARKYGKAVTRYRADLSAVLLEALQGLSEILVFGQEKTLLTELKAANQSLEVAGVKLARAGAAGGALVGLLNHVTLWVILVLAIPLAHEGQLDGVSLAVLILVTLTSFEAVLPLTQTAQHLEGALSSADRLFSLADARPAVVPPLVPIPGPSGMDLKVRSLTFRYHPGSPAALANLDLDLPAGRRIAIVGPSGAGKSTLASLLLRFWDCPPESIQLDGQDIRRYDPNAVRKKVGLVQQSAYLFSGSLRQNLRIASPEASGKEMEQALAFAGLSEMVSRLPKGLDTWLGSQGEQLSGGEKQRLALARASLQKPGIWILDEPMAGLDAAAGKQLLDVVRSKGISQPGGSLILITHHLPGLDWLDEIVVLQEGKVLERGTHVELIRAGGWYANALELQRKVIDPQEFV